MTPSPIVPPILDAAAIRAELAKNPEDHGLTPATAQTLIEMSDDQLNAALEEAAHDTFWVDFWEIRNNTRSNAIASLVTVQLDANIVVSDPAEA